MARRWWPAVVLGCGVLLPRPAPGQQAPLPITFRTLVETPEAQFDQSFAVTGEQRVVLGFCLQPGGQGYRLRLSGQGAALDRLDPQPRELAQAARPYSAQGTHQVLVRRRESSLHVVVDGRLALSVLDGTWHGGAAGVAEADAARVKATADGYQAVEDIFFTDDFMRTKDQQQLGVWRHVSGKWRFYSVLETNERADVKLSVNPFSLGLDSDELKPAAVVTGYPFWADYTYEASLRSRGGAWAGLIFGHRADDDCFLFRADLRELPQRPRRIELVRVAGGKETVLAGGTALLSAEQWYRLGVRLRGPRLQCLLDGDVLFDRVDPECLGGPVGLWSCGRASETLFDDVRCLTNYEWPMDRLAELQEAAGEKVGEWVLEPTGGRIDNDPGARRLAARGGRPSRYVFGDPAAGSYRLDGRVELAESGDVSLLFAYRDAANYYYTEWSHATGKLRIGQVVEGEAKPLGLVTDRLEPGRPHTFGLDLLASGRVQVRRDGLLRMRAPVKDLPVGRAGLATGGEGAVFSDLVIKQFEPVDTEIEVDNSNFAGDPFMLHWASSLADWFPKGDPQQEANRQQIYWHKGDFYRAYHLDLPVKSSLAVLLNATEERWLPPSDAVVQQKIVKVDEVADKQYAGDGYLVQVVPGEGQAAVSLFRQGTLVKTALLPAGTEQIRLAHDGGVTWIMAGGEDVLVYHDYQPLTGPRVALRVNGNDELYKVKCRREGIIDEVFERAPAAWTEQGNWEITNRFSCTPTWSHMSALERQGLGALFHKSAFPGNVTVEYYAGMRMQSDYAMSYPRPGDFNCTLAARPFDLASGISLLPGAWDPGWTSIWTRLVKGDQVIAETDRPLVPRTREDGGRRYIPVPYISAGRDIHGAWYYVKCRYVDGHLEGYFDNVKVLDHEAPPVDGDRVAVWTQDDQIVIARVRITYQHKVIPHRLLDRPAVEPAPTAEPTAILTAAAAPGVSFDFEDGVAGWAARDRYRGVSVEAADDGGRRYLLVRNHLPGDSFEAVMPLGNKANGQPDVLDLTRAAVLRLDYRVPPETRVNAYLTLNGRRFTVPFTGVAEDSPAMPVLVRPAEVVADGKWHTARLPLGAALTRRFGKTTVHLTDFRFGQLHQGYLLAGFGGNPTGAWYAVDNLTFVSEVKAEVPLGPALRFLPGAGGEVPSVKTLRLAVDRDAKGVPREAPDPATLKTPAENGYWFLHAQAELADGTLTRTVHQPLLVMATPPALAPVAAAAPWDGGPLRLGFGDSAPVEAAVTVDKSQLGWAQCCRVDAERQQLVVDPRASRLSYTDGQVVPIKVVATFASGLSSEVTVERTYRTEADREPPAPPVVSGPTWYQDMEQGSPTWSVSTPAATDVAADADTPDGGGHSVKVTNLTPAGTMATTWLSEQVDLGSHPVLMFDYKMPEPVRADLMAYLPAEYYTIAFTDGADTYYRVATIGEPKRDGQWHRAQLNLQKALAAASPFAANMYSLRQLVSADHGYSGTAPNAAYWVDNLRLVGVASGKLGVKLAWTATDPGTIAGYRVGFSTEETAEPATAIEPGVTEQVFRPEAEGLYWFAVQARDGAGNWSRVTRVPVLVDNTPPRFDTPVPAPGSLGTWNVRVPLAGLGLADLDPASLRLTAGGQTVPAREGEVTYQSERALTWDWCWATKQFTGKVADGTKLRLAMTGKDTAGNEATPAAWDYTISFAADKQPPLAPEVKVPSQPLHKLETCTAGLGQLGYLSSSYRSARQRVYDPERRDHVCEVITSGSGVPLCYGAVDLKKTPFLSFDYQVPSRVLLHLVVYARDTYYSIRLNGKSRYYKEIGSVAFEADGKWHTAVLDLQALLATVDKSLTDVRYIQLDEYRSGGGQHYKLDNVAVFGPVATGSLAAQWVNYDATGIQAAAATLTPGLDAAAPSSFTADQTSASLAASRPGFYLLQVASKDGAGNVGGLTRRVIAVR